MTVYNIRCVDIFTLYFYIFDNHSMPDSIENHVLWDQMFIFEDLCSYMSFFGQKKNTV